MRRKIKLIFGLGNEGEIYKNTRHNIGKDLVSSWLKKPINLHHSVFEKVDKTLYVATNLTFVNESGKSLKELQTKLKLKPEEILVIHDDADIIFPFLKFSFGASSAGHKGIESIIRYLKTKNFWRLRIGINKKKRLQAEKLVLKKWGQEELKVVKKMKEKLQEILIKGLKERLPNELNLPKDYFNE